MKKFLPYFKGYRWDCFLAPVFKLLEALMDLAVPLVIAAMIDRGLSTGDEGFLVALGQGLERIAAWGADTLVLALGLDPFEGDPFAGLKVTTPGFARIGRAVASAGLPTVIVQEGGYLCPELGDNLAAVLSGW